MDLSPPDAAARHEGLEHWAEEQRRRLHPPKARGRLRRMVADPLLRPNRLARGFRVADRAVDRLADRFLGRGLDTSGYSFVPEHKHPDRLHYAPTPWHLLPRALRYIGVSENDTFVDFGCGKGRVVHQAAKRPFRRVIGVEISPDLAQIARSVLAAGRHQHRCQNVEIVVADATQWRVPDDLTIAYLFRPFENDLLDAVLQGISDSLDRHPRRLRLIYVWPTDRSRSKVLATERFRLLKEYSSSLLNPRGFRVLILESR
jgi:SAM-dependent methyltransferase